MAIKKKNLGTSFSRNLHSVMLIVVFILILVLQLQSTNQIMSKTMASLHVKPISVNTNDIPSVTVTMTTCNRLDLTRESLESFFKFNANAISSIKSFKMVIDCFNGTFVDAISKEFPTIQFIRPITQSTVPYHRMMDNIQLLYTHVKQEGTDYWVHMEDDWKFVAPNFIVDGIKVLESVGKNSSIWMVVGREPNSFLPHVNNTFGWRNAGNVSYSILRVLSGGGASYCSYTSNDAVISVKSAMRLELNFSQHDHEANLSRELGLRGVHVAILQKHRYYHTGGNSTTMRNKVDIST